MNINFGQAAKDAQFADMINIEELALTANSCSTGGADELYFLGAPASTASKAALNNVISQVAETCFVPLTVGGGVRRIRDVGKLLRAGADRVLISSTGAAGLEFIATCVDKYGSQCIVASVDCRAVNGAWEVYSHGGARATGIDALEYVCRAVQFGASEILLTSTGEDGAKISCDIALIKSVSSIVSVPVTASC